MINHYTAVGNLVRDPEVRMTTSGIPVATMRVAISTSRKNQNGEYQTLYMNVTAWRNVADRCRQYMHKGDTVIISGELQPREYTTRDGSKRNETEMNASDVVQIRSASQSRPNNNTDYNEANSVSYNPHYLDGAEEVDDTADLPF